MLKDHKRINQDMLKQAIKQGDMELFDYIMEKDACLADEQFGKSLNWPIHIACEYGRIEIVKKLIKQYEVQSLDSICPLSSYTPLMYAVQAGQEDILRYLISIKADYKHISAFSGRNATQIAIDAQFDRIASIIERQNY